ncbi:MAG TPA: DinB family protein [Bryobacteraceae bacterium]|nr:DinB family protein [Bryobacteraceae bacterium]
MAIRDALLAEFDHEMATTRRVLERCPEAKFGWKPHPRSFDMASLATHIVNMVGWSVETIQKDSVDIAPPGQPPYKEEPVTSQKELLDRFDKNVAAARAAIAGAEDDQMVKEWSLLNGGQVAFTMPRVAVLRTFIMNHAIHHRAQLGVYLRLNDIPVPSSYGPSADESPM